MSQLLTPAEAFCSDPDCKFGTGAGYGQWLEIAEPPPMSKSAWAFCLGMAFMLAIYGMSVDV
jgi:hypothetical protein